MIPVATAVIGPIIQRYAQCEFCWALQKIDTLVVVDLV